MPVVVEPLVIFEFMTSSTKDLKIVESVITAFVFYFFDVVEFQCLLTR